MPDENTLFKDINTATPADGDLAKFGAAEIRLNRKALKKFLFLEHGVDGGHLYGVDSGSANAYVVELGAVTQLAAIGLFAGLRVMFKVTNSNTTTSTLLLKVSTVAVGTAKAVKLGGANILSGTLVAGRIVEVIYDGTDWQLVSGWAVAPVIAPFLPEAGLVWLYYFTAGQVNWNPDVITQQRLATQVIVTTGYSKLLLMTQMKISNLTGANRRIYIQHIPFGVFSSFSVQQGSGTVYETPMVLELFDNSTPATGFEIYVRWTDNNGTDVSPSTSLKAGFTTHIFGLE